MRRLVRFALMLCAPSAGLCSTAGPGTISHFTSAPGGIAVFEQTGIRTAAPGCSDPIAVKRWAVDASDPAGAALLDLLMTAEELHTPILLVGSDTCPNSVAVEKLISFTNAQ